MAIETDSSDRNAALLEATLEAAVDAIVLADAEGTIVKVNPAACEMFQRTATEMVEQNVRILMPEGVAALHDGFMRHHIETGENRIIGTGRDVDGLRQDGSIFPLHLSVGETRVDGQRMFVGILHDLTQRAAMQTALARSQRLDAVGQMTGGIAHDFNNLLTVVIGNLELLQMKEPEGERAALVKDALEAAELGADLTSRLMVFAGKSNLKPAVSDLGEICEQALTILKRLLGDRIRITTEIAPGPHRVLIDPAQLQSALVNLVLNARDAMGDTGELLIAVDDVKIDDKYMAQEVDVGVGQYVRLSVSDDGEGMSEEAQKRAFEPFFTTKFDRGGNGLGLAMVYGFVRQSGGHVTLYSEPGMGTSFGLYFPAISENSDEADEPAANDIGDAESSIGKGRTVLVVEDNPKVRKLSVSRVRSLGFHVEEASDADQAYAMLKDGLHVDAVFSDLVMPGSMTGYDLAEKVLEHAPDTKILLTSGYASDVVTVRMERGVRYEVLHKPFRQSDLARRLQALFADDADG